MPPLLYGGVTGAAFFWCQAKESPDVKYQFLSCDHATFGYSKRFMTKIGFHPTHYANDDVYGGNTVKTNNI